MLMLEIHTKIMKKLLSLVPNLIKWLYEGDKVLHILFSTVIALFVFALLNLFMGKWESILCSFCFTLAVGVVKEVYDKFSPNHSAAFSDLLADVIGIALALVPLTLI